MSKKEIKHEAMKKEIGLRFKEFRQFIKKNQQELAEELKVCQSTITGIETGKIFPCIPFQYYLNCKYHLNINWLLTGKEKIIISPEGNSKYADLPLLFWHISDDEPRFERYVELISLMRIQVIEQIILGKLADVKAIAKEEIKTFFEET